ncbi:MAG: NAD(P)H-dependent glycerol-3-phosphate dehydrogenase [Prochloraceae cyanobacterium]|nr:NAD(P)H-dependent glycerol-3-phosphate dehydrogenase [Prochloraceae cyanobacterium]
MKSQAKKITILGSGVWGKTLGLLASRACVTLWSRRSPETIESAIEEADVILSAVAIKGVRPTIAKLQNVKISNNPILVTATKGLDPLTSQTPSQIWHEAFPDYPIVVLSGPNLSKEIQKGLPAATVVASHDRQAAETVQGIFASEKFRVYLNQDPLGTELGGTLKNIMAIAAGVCDGMQLGTNAKAALLTRALREMIRVGTFLGADRETFFGLSGLGDLLATCDSPLSRNYQVGYRLAEGKNLEQILSELEGTAEGVNTTAVLVNLAREKDIIVPISSQVDRLLKGESTPLESVSALMKRDLKAEFYDLDF